MKSDTPQSACCQASMKVVGDLFSEGTNHYECDRCGMPCDIYVPKRDINTLVELTEPDPVSSNAEDAERADLIKQIFVVHEAAFGNSHCFLSGQAAAIADFILARDTAQRQAVVEARIDELTTAAPHFCDKPTNFVYYNERLAALQQLKSPKGKE